MTGYNLTSHQKELLRILVQGVKAGEVEEPIIPNYWISSTGWEIDGIKDNFDNNLIGDLDVLCRADLLASLDNSHGKKSYSIKQNGYDAVENDFMVSEGLPSTQINIGAIVHEMKNGYVQAVGSSDNSELNQLVNNSGLLHKKLDELTEQLINVVKSELSSKKLLEYLRTIEELKKEIESEKPSPSVLQKLFASISFFGDMESTISLITRVLPYIYPLLQIASQKLASGG
ncbi:MAG: hypothetical protein LC111_09550 [Bacteroidia bacterium]|nr:hypothetical protein [Bacteroidia bacterium]